MSNYIVDPVNGADPNSGLTESTAWKTLLKASDTLIAGDTARLRGGPYLPNDGNVGLRTKRNGAAGAPITFRNYGAEIVTIKGQFIGVMVDHSFIALKGLAVINDNQGAMETGICHWFDHGQISNVTVEDCVVRNMKPGDPSHGIRLEGVSYAVVRRCIMDHIGTAPQPGPEGGNGLWITGNYCLVEDNQVDFCGHAGLFLMGDRVVARRNNFNGTWGVCAEYLCYNTTNFRSLIEDNILRNASGLQDGLWRDPAWEQMGSGTIFRRNRIYRGVGAAFQIYSRQDYQSKHNRFYHNVAYDCGGVPPPSYLCAPYEIQEDVAGTQGDNISVNNIHFFNKRNDRATFAGTGNQAVLVFLVNSWNDTDPMFRDPASGDFRLCAGSPCIDTGQFLTKLRSNGSGRTLEVEDAGYFCDGWGIVEGDYIQLEGTDEAIQIASIDYANNIITLKEGASWQVGQGVSLPFLGTKPDIGAFEYLGGIMPKSIDIILNIQGIPDYSIVADKQSASFQRGQSATFKITASGIDGYNKPIPLSISGLPPNVTAQFSPTSIWPGEESILTIMSTVAAIPGAYTINVKGPDIS